MVPGEIISEERKRLGSHVFIENGKIYSDCLGIAEVESETAAVIPLHGKYMPYAGDLIVGIIVSEKYSGYTVDINSFYSSFISKDEFREQLKPGTVISAKIDSVNEINEATLGDVRVFYGGEIISVSPVKVPRLIGKNGSMLTVLKNGTKSSILVGRNGRVWAKGGNINMLIDAIRKIEREAHMSNLTNTMDAYLQNLTEKTGNSYKVNE